MKTKQQKYVCVGVNPCKSNDDDDDNSDDVSCCLSLCSTTISGNDSTSSSNSNNDNNVEENREINDDDDNIVKNISQNVTTSVCSFKSTIENQHKELKLLKIKTQEKINKLSKRLATIEAELNITGLLLDRVEINNDNKDSYVTISKTDNEVKLKETGLDSKEQLVVPSKEQETKVRPSSSRIQFVEEEDDSNNDDDDDDDDDDEYDGSAKVEDAQLDSKAETKPTSTETKATTSGDTDEDKLQPESKAEGTNNKDKGDSTAKEPDDTKKEQASADNEADETVGAKDPELSYNTIYLLGKLKKRLRNEETMTFVHNIYSKWMTAISQGTKPVLKPQMFVCAFDKEMRDLEMVGWVLADIMVELGMTQNKIFEQCFCGSMDSITRAVGKSKDGVLLMRGWLGSTSAVITINKEWFQNLQDNGTLVLFAEPSRRFKQVKSTNYVKKLVFGDNMDMTTYTSG